MQKRPAGRGAFFLKKNSLSQNCLSPGGRFGFPSSESQVRRVVAATLPHPLASRGDSAALGGWIEGQNRQCRARGELPSLGKLITELQTRKRVALWDDTQSDAGNPVSGKSLLRVTFDPLQSCQGSGYSYHLWVRAQLRAITVACGPDLGDGSDQRAGKAQKIWRFGVVMRASVRVKGRRAAPAPDNKNRGWDENDE